MAEPARVQMTGWAELQAELRALPEVLQRRIVKGAAGTAANIIKRAIIDRAPVYSGKVSEGHPPPGTLKRSIYATRLSDECTATREVWLVGVRSGKRWREVTRGRGARAKTVNMDAFYAKWVEYGHYSRPPKSIGASKAARRKVVHEAQRLVKGAHWVMARPFFRPGFAASAGPALKASEDYMRQKLTTATIAMKYLKAGR